MQLELKGSLVELSFWVGAEMPSEGRKYGGRISRKELVSTHAEEKTCVSKGQQGPRLVFSGIESGVALLLDRVDRLRSVPC